MNLPDKIDPAHTALIVIDIQNDFCSPTGLMGKMGKNVKGMDEFIENIQKLIEVCDRAKLPVFYTQQIYDRTKLNDLQKEQYDLDGKMVTCDIAGSGWKFYKLNPPKEQVYVKYVYNIFSNEELKRKLQDLDIKTLIITGVSTQICVETAVRNGFDLGYKIVVPEELIATTSSDPDIQERTLRLIRKTYGTLTSREEITRILQEKYT